MKRLLIGDQHFTVKNVRDVEIFIRELEQWLSCNKRIDQIVLLGDLLHYHERQHTLARNMAETFVTLLVKYAPVVILVGNHDYIDNSQFCNDKHWLNALKRWDRVTVVDTPIMIDNALFCPYVPKGRFREAIDSIPNWREAHLICAHQEFKGVNMDSGTTLSIDGDPWDTSNPPVYSGHIHHKQWVQPNLYYVGSILQHSYAEKADKSLLLVEDGQWLEEVFLNLPIKQTLIHDTTSIKTADITATYNTRVNISGTAKELGSFKRTKQYKELLKQGVKVNMKRIDQDDVVIKKASLEQNVLRLIADHPQYEKLKVMWNKVK
jgi:DNA repair exonuclease SbcCD nuclease subunit